MKDLSFTAVCVFGKAAVTVHLPPFLYWTELKQNCSAKEVSEHFSQSKAVGTIAVKINVFERNITSILKRHELCRCWSLLYSTIYSLCSHVILHEWIAFYSAFLNIHRSDVLTALAWLEPHETAPVSALSVYTIQPCTMSLHAKPHT